MSDLSFSFIKDESVRKVIEEYWSQAQKANECEVFAGAVFLCGAVLEGLLAWAVTYYEEEARTRFTDEFKQKDGKSNKPISQWGMTELIKVAKGLDLIGKTSIRLLGAVQDFRNFIHPYNVKQQSSRPDERIALISLKTVEEVTRSLIGRITRVE